MAHVQLTLAPNNCRVAALCLNRPDRKPGHSGTECWHALREDDIITIRAVHIVIQARLLSL